ncbi:MAG: Endonuclease/exonuclease/phosphatase, partial [Nocardioides sp.]|nr:Endonuclease/exonuclease/phosphatase [Nocardioides sp.]
MSRFSRAPIARSSLAAAAGLAVAVSGLAIAPSAVANPAGTGLVISEVYGGGGNAGAQYTNDFIELYNPTGSAISVAGMSVQYRSATGTSAQVTPLAGSVPAGGHYLVQEAAGATPSAALPTPDATGTISMSGTGGVVLLVPTTTAFTTTGNLAGNAALLDMVGYGTTAASYETVNTGVALTNSTAASRSAAGADSDNNAADFSEGAPAPQNVGDVTPPAPEEFTGSIAEIQGTDTATSPHVGDIATTQGVVTALYPAGGFNGLYIQTAGTGGATDATPGASDGVFVYGQNVDESAYSIGDFLEVAGVVSEFAGTTEITPAAATDVTELATAHDPVTALATTLPETGTAREAHEGEVLAPSGPFTVTNTFATNQYAEVGLAAGTTPLIAPTEVADAQDTAAIAAVTADNAARAITLDDGASLNFLSAANQATPLPWLSTSNPIRVGAPVTFTGPVILEFRNSVWKLQPTTQVTDEGAGTATFANTRTPAPADVGGDIRLATFNVFNYFPTTADEFVALGGGRTCTTYKDRDGNPVTANTCAPNGPRGAANPVNLARQQAKIVTAINKLGASIVSLEELENSVQFGKDRDFAISTLVAALNTAAGSAVWDYAPSPAAADLPAPAQEDVIRTGFIYRPADVTLVGAAKVLIDETHFGNAREPLAQAFKPAHTSDANAFAVIVNHFKSKGSGVDDGTGQGNANPDRVGQAQALTTFASSFASERGTDAVFLAGDFNSYSMEDPMQVLYGAGYTAIESDTAGEETYSFSGLSGSLDHVLANAAALGMVTGADVWNINSGESVAFEYTRYNYNVTDFYQANPYRASDHDPEVVGIDLPGFPVETSVSATAQPMTYGADGSVSVSVTPGTATGTVTVLDGDTVLGDAALSGGTADVVIPGTALQPGQHALTVRYGGDATYAPSN